MNTLIIYDSFFGNTEKIARAIFQTFSPLNSIKICLVNDYRPEYLNDIDLLIIGSPTRGFRPTPAISCFLKRILSKDISGRAVAAFDTRLALNEINSSALRFIVKNGGYAAKRMAYRLVKAGGILRVPPEGFYVSGEEGPLLDAECNRAARWTQHLILSLQDKSVQTTLLKTT